MSLISSVVSNRQAIEVFPLDILSSLAVLQVLLTLLVCMNHGLLHILLAHKQGIGYSSPVQFDPHRVVLS